MSVVVNYHQKDSEGGVEFLQNVCSCLWDDMSKHWRPQSCNSSFLFENVHIKLLGRYKLCSVSNHVYVGYFVTRMCSLQLFLVKCARHSLNPPCLSLLFVNLNDCGNWNETFTIALSQIIWWYFTSYLYILIFYLIFNITFLNSGNCFEIPPPTFCIYLFFSL